MSYSWIKMSMPLDNNLCKELGQLVETLTHAGHKTLDNDLLKKLKNICKKCDGYIDHVYHLLIYQLQKAHAEIRFSAFQICDELFRRSHCFRELLVSNLQHIIELTCETSDQPLPPPRSVALNLKRLALQTIEDWNQEYGDGYKKLHLGYKFLKHCKKVDFNVMQLETSAELTIRQERERRLAIVNEEKLMRTTTEIKDLQPEISNTLTSLESCIALLLPTPEDFFIQEESDRTILHKQFNNGSFIHNKSEDKHSLDVINNDSEIHDLDIKPSTSKSIKNSKEIGNSTFDCETTDSSDPGDESFNFREYGIFNGTFSMEVNLNRGAPVIKETIENAAIFENAKDLYTLITNRYIPTVKKWIQVLIKSSGNSDELKNVINMKQKLDKAVESYQQLKTCSSPDYESSSSNSDFEEVEEKEGFEKVAYEDFTILTSSVSTESLKTRRNKSNWNIWSEENDEKDPTSAQSTLTILKSTKVASNEQEFHMVTEPKPSTSKEEPSFTLEEDRKTKLLAIAPKVPFDIDLYHWEDDKIKVPTMVAVRAEGSRFWHSTQEELEEVPVPDGVKSIRTRVIEFSGKFEPVLWSCRAPLPSGKLCPRHDRHKCPFHGPIVPRDKTGNCSNPEDAERVATLEDHKNSENPDWQDPQLLEDIKKATGMDLKMPEKKKKKKKKKRGRMHDKKIKFPGLADVKARKNTTYTRLSKKIFKRGAMSKIARTMDVLDHKRFRDKFGDQFHYMHNTA